MFVNRDIKKGAFNLMIKVNTTSEGESSNGLNENISDKIDEYLIAMRKQYESKDVSHLVHPVPLDIQNAVEEYESSFFSLCNSNRLVRKKQMRACSHDKVTDTYQYLSVHI